LAVIANGDLLGRSALFWSQGRQKGDLGFLSSAVLDCLPELWRTQRSSRVTVDLEDGNPVDLCLVVQAPNPTLVMVGAVHITEVLVDLARKVGFRTVVVDPRRAFATPERFSRAHEVIRRWPQEAFARIPLNESTYVALLSHDPKLDLPALKAVLREDVRYIGALGSRRTHEKRKKTLRDDGYSEDEIARIHAPIGLPLGGRRAEEIALSVLAEVVACRYGGRER
jgi:xanthine dehydrogenase accessory factor